MQKASAEVRRAGEKENVVYTQQIGYTDFPLDTITLYNDGGILCLPGER